MNQAQYLNDLDGLINECGNLHGHICPGQVLGVRMSMLGCHLIGISDPRGAERKKLLVWVEIDRCLTDAICAVTGVRLGKRSLKYFDYGKVAATFLNLTENLSVRILAKDESRELADVLYPEIESKKERQMLTYRTAVDAELFRIEYVQIELSDLELPGSPKRRLLCSLCGEGVNDGREISDALGQIRCRACAFGAYYQSVQPDKSASDKIINAKQKRS